MSSTNERSIDERSESARQPKPTWYQSAGVRSLARIALCLLLVAFLISGAACYWSKFMLSMNWYFRCFYVVVGCIFACSMCLAFLEMNPFKRLLLFHLIPTTIFSATLFGTIIVTSYWYGYSPPKLGIQALAIFTVVPMVALPIWLLRLQRGWRIAYFNLDAKDRFDEEGIDFEDKRLEYSGVGCALALGALPLGIGLMVDDATSLLLPQVPVNFLVGLAYVFPLVYVMMRTRFPLLVGSVLAVGLPMLAFSIAVAFQLRDFADFGLINDVTRAITRSVITLFLMPVVFMLLLRLAGFKFVAVKNWRQKKRIIKATTVSVPKKHPLDD